MAEEHSEPLTYYLLQSTNARILLQRRSELYLSSQLDS